MTRLVKVYGERHTGTRVVTRAIRGLKGVRLAPAGTRFNDALPLVERAIAAIPRPVPDEVRRALREAFTDDLTIADGPLGAWKHAAARFHADFASKDVHVVFVVKSPGAWLTSFFRRPYHRLSARHDTFHGFVTSPWICVRREFTPSVVRNPVVLWNLKVASYVKFAAKAEKAGVKTLFVRSEDLILDQVASVRRIADWLGATPPDDLGEIDADTKGKGRTLDDLKRYYGEEQWRRGIEAASLAFIAREADASLVDRFGYASTLK